MVADNPNLKIPSRRPSGSSCVTEPKPERIEAVLAELKNHGEISIYLGVHGKWQGFIHLGGGKYRQFELQSVEYEDAAFEFLNRTRQSLKDLGVST